MNLDFDSSNMSLDMSGANIPCTSPPASLALIRIKRSFIFATNTLAIFVGASSAASVAQIPSLTCPLVRRSASPNCPLEEFGVKHYNQAHILRKDIDLEDVFRKEDDRFGVMQHASLNGERVLVKCYRRRSKSVTEKTEQVYMVVSKSVLR